MITRGFDAEWLHDVRNAVNASCAAVEMARRAMDAGNAERAGEFLADAERACARCRELLHAKIPAQDSRGT